MATIKRFFYDCEFIEDGETIDLISIGIVGAESEVSDRRYYACNAECDLTKASDWVKDHVIPHLPSKYLGIDPNDPDILPSVKNEALTWKSRQQIRDDIVKFIFGSAEGQTLVVQEEIEIELWADYAAYDHVALCQLFGRMIELPSGFPMYTNDIQQLKKALRYQGDLPQADPLDEHHALNDALLCRSRYRFLMDLMPKLKGQEQIAIWI